MSGGHFEYQQHRLRDIADTIDSLILNNKVEDEYGYKRDYSPEVLEKFKKASTLLKKAYDMAHEIDWLVSGDTDEDAFLENWKEKGLDD